MPSPIVLVSGSYAQLRNGTLTLGAGTIEIGSSVTDYANEIWLSSSETTLHTAGPELAAYNLGASGTNAGAYSIGIDASLLTSMADPLVTDLMSALAQLDAAIAAGGGGNQLMQPFLTDGAVTAGQVVAVSPSNNDRVVVADAANGLSGTIVGIALTSSPGAGNSIDVAMGGLVSTLSGLTRGLTYYLGSSSNANAGNLVSTPPSALGDLIIRIGYSMSPTSLVMHVGEGTQL